jgi:hypothetical protein
LFCSGHYYRIDQPFGLRWFDLVDVFKADVVKTNVNYWLKTNAELIRGIAANLGTKIRHPATQEMPKNIPAPVEPPLVKDVPKIVLPPVEHAPPLPEPPATMEIAQVMKPPPPPAKTVQGYNPVMDEPRPTVMEDYLR